MSAAEIAGWTGTGLVLVWYFLLSQGHMAATGYAANGMTAVNAALLTWNFAAHGSVPGIALQAIFALIAVAAIITRWRKLRRP